MHRLDINNAIFQQDNVALHTSKLTKKLVSNIKYWRFGLAY